MRCLVIVVLVLVAVGAGPRMSWAKDADCWDLEKTGEVSIRACTKIIKSKRVFGKRTSKTNLAAAYYQRGFIYQTKGQYDRAIADYTKAIKLRPKNAGNYVSRGLVYRDKGQYDRAIADYTKTIELNPKYASAHLGRGIVYGKRGQYDRAIDDYDQAIRLNPKDAGAYYSRGLAYREKAIADYRKALEIDPTYESHCQLSQGPGAWC